MDRSEAERLGRDILRDAGIQSAVSVHRDLPGFSFPADGFGLTGLIRLEEHEDVEMVFFIQGRVTFEVEYE